MPHGLTPETRPMISKTKVTLSLHTEVEAEEHDGHDHEHEGESTEEPEEIGPTVETRSTVDPFTGRGSPGYLNSINISLIIMLLILGVNLI